MSARQAIRVRAPARLHLGLFDLRGELGRRFGGAGMALATPTLVLDASPAPTLSARGPESERLLSFARRFLEHHHLETGAHLELRRTIPAHSGLGSGTQLGLAVARALAALNGLPSDAPSLAAAVERARRSAVGTWAFERGGFILEGGRRAGSDRPAPLLLQHPVPPSWRCILAIPEVPRGLSGEAEERAFRTLAPPSSELVQEISHLVLMLMLPSLVEGDLAGFGAAVTRVQRLVGESFRPVQGAVYAHPIVGQLIDELLTAGAAGAGQSSWGPTVYGFVEGDAAASALVVRLRGKLGKYARIMTSRFDNAGALVSRKRLHRESTETAERADLRRRWPGSRATETT